MNKDAMVHVQRSFIKREVVRGMGLARVVQTSRRNGVIEFLFLPEIEEANVL